MRRLAGTQEEAQKLRASVPPAFALRTTSLTRTSAGAIIGGGVVRSFGVVPEARDRITGTLFNYRAFIRPVAPHVSQRLALSGSCVDRLKRPGTPRHCGFQRSGILTRTYCRSRKDGSLYPYRSQANRFS